MAGYRPRREFFLCFLTLTTVSFQERAKKEINQLPTTPIECLIKPNVPTLTSHSETTTLIKVEILDIPTTLQHKLLAKWC